MELTDAQFERYARHLILDEVGDAGQEKLLQARVLVVGAGGLGAPMLLYLAAAGVGTIGIIDDDHVDLSNLQRQVIHMTERVGSAKTQSAAATIAAVNPDIVVEQHATRLTADNVMALINDYDVIADGSDNFSTRYLLNDACHLAGKTLVAGALLRFEGQLSTFRSGVSGRQDAPCYRCLFPAPPAAEHGVARPEDGDGLALGDARDGGAGRRGARREECALRARRLRARTASGTCQGPRLCAHRPPQLCSYC